MEILANLRNYFGKIYHQFAIMAESFFEADLLIYGEEILKP